ncbi:MAG: hypothetical protein VW600_14865 [Ferrovibrio sp.]
MVTAPACEHLAYEFDEAARIVNVVYIGAIEDAEVLDFYGDLLRLRPDAPGYDFLVDMRYTEWLASPAMLATLDALFRFDSPQPRLRRVAIVRKDTVARDRTQQDLLRNLKSREVRYFTDMDVARVWLRSLL